MAAEAQHAPPVGRGEEDIAADLRITDNPLEPFAKVWLFPWTSHGGAVVRQPDDRILVGWSEYSDGPDHGIDEERIASIAGLDATVWLNDAGMHAGYIERLRAYHRAYFDGRMRSWSELLDAVPGGCDAVKALVFADPALGLPIVKEGE